MPSPHRQLPPLAGDLHAAQNCGNAISASASPSVPHCGNRAFLFAAEAEELPNPALWPFIARQ
jgi:hypothetical protein